jgi:signal transduction histidine kinase
MDPFKLRASSGPGHALRLPLAAGLLTAAATTILAGARLGGGAAAIVGLSWVDGWILFRYQRIEAERRREQAARQDAEAALERALEELADRKHARDQAATVGAALRDQNALVQLGKMAAVVAHEVRNPLAGIKGALQVIGGRLPAAGQEQAIVNDIIARLDTLNAIVQDLLLFARPIQPALATVPVSAVIEETVRLFRQDLSMAGVTVDVERSPALVTVDAQQLKLVLLNLLLNGAQAMRGRGRIIVRTTRGESTHTIQIIDEGPGLPAEAREHLFEPFFTTRHRGTGLGLVTARRIMEAHGGRVSLDCPPGGGTVAALTLPAR